MASDFDLIITTDYPSRTAELRLLDADGSQLAFRQTDFKAIPVSRQHGLFDLRNYVDHYVEPTQEAAGVAEIGVCVAEDVLGSEICRRLWESEAQRTLRIQLPGATQEHDHLAAALARIPWEIARPDHDKPTLSERNLLLRVVHGTNAPATTLGDLAKNECLRVLFIFAESRGSHPLAMRMERRALQKLFEEEIYPQRRVVADFLTHGVTRERLEAQVKENGGYHVVHWSGHGHVNLLELATPSGTSDPISGRELLDLFIKAGGFIPRLFFLSACHSGDILHVEDWNDVLAIAQGERTRANRAPITETKAISLEENPGYTGTAHALLQGSVPSVVAMRYAVGDDYARDLGIEFYRALLAHSKPKTTAAALAMARNSLTDPRKHPSDCYAACDHATPILYGEEDSRLTLHEGRSPSLQIRNRRLHQIADLTTAAHEHFVGRTWELTFLGASFIGAPRGTGVKPVAVVTGLGGMGKTALAAEALALWESRFDWVLLYQFKPSAIGFEVTLRDIHLTLNAERGHYHEHVKKHPADAVYRAADAEFTGEQRLERLTRNLIRALRDEAILLVLDNFETNLKAQAEQGSPHPLWTCQDPAWDYCLARLATELIGTPSRILLTCRRPLAALAKVSCNCILGTLPAGEAALYLREHSGLSKMIFGSDLAERTLALRLLDASRFHPLLMARLARLTASPNLRTQLLQTLDALENIKGFSQLPALFASSPGDAAELAYLEDAFATLVDQLICASSREARRLLWVIAIANEPVTLDLLQKICTDLVPRIESVPLVRQLVATGLVTEDQVGLVDGFPDFICHEFVRERICIWMDEHPKERGDLTPNVHLAHVREAVGSTV